MDSIGFLKIVAVYLIPKLAHGDSEEWNSFRVEILDQEGLFRALIFHMENFNMELCSPIVIDSVESFSVSSALYAFNDFLSNCPNEIIGSTIEDALKLTSDRLRANGYKKFE